MAETKTEYVVAPETTGGAVRVVAGIDIGKALTCIAYDTGDGVKVLPAFPTLKTARGVYEVVHSGPDAYVLTMGDIPRAVGRLAAMLNTPNIAGSDERYYNGWSLDFALTALCAALPSAAHIDATIATGVPAEMYTSETARAVADSLKGRHAFKFNGADRVVTIAVASIEREGFAAFGAIDPAPVGRVLIVDGGGGTFNLIDVDEGAMRNVKTLNGYGVEYVLDDLSKEARARFGRTLDAEERNALLAALVAGDEYSITINNKPQSVSKRARAMFDAAARDVATLITSNVKVGKYDEIYLIGGAMLDGLMGAEMRRLMPNAKAISNRPWEDNAVGLAKIAGASGKRKGRK